MNLFPLGKAMHAIVRFAQRVSNEYLNANIVIYCVDRIFYILSGDYFGKSRVIIHTRYISVSIVVPTTD